ncbi:MAG: ABC transporter ATP-binding protein [Nitrososphaerales archaeon]
MGALSIRNLSKKFAKTDAVSNFSIEVQDKEFLVLLGPSGCGKSTILRCLAGLEEPDKGEIFVDGSNITNLPPKTRDIAMVFQNYALYPHMSVFDNLAFPLKMRKIPSAEIRERVKKTADLLRIGELLTRKPRELSGGQRQRVAVGRAVIREPKLFLMDEPLSNLDAKLRTYMRSELKALQKELGVTTVYVTHDQVEAMTMADRVAIMNDGVLLQLGAPREIYEDPSDVFVAGFLGSPPTNLIECSAQIEKGRCSLKTQDFSLDVGKRFINLQDGRKFILGIRPRFVSLSKAQKGIQGEVYLVEPTGDEVIINVKIGETLLKVLSQPNIEIKPGQKVSVSIPAERIYLFDDESGKRTAH